MTDIDSFFQDFQAFAETHGFFLCAEGDNTGRPTSINTLPAESDKNMLLLALMSCLTTQSWFSWRDHEGKEVQEGFIAGINLPVGTITYCLPGNLYPVAKRTQAMELPNAPVPVCYTDGSPLGLLEQFATR